MGCCPIVRRYEIARVKSPCSTMSKTAPDSQILDGTEAISVFRQLTQDVKGLWNFLAASTSKEDGSLDPGAAIGLASKMVGRLAKWSAFGKVSEIRSRWSFGRETTLAIARQIVLVSVVRLVLAFAETNPRDSLQDSSAKASIKLANHRRIILPWPIFWRTGRGVNGSARHHERSASQ